MLGYENNHNFQINKHIRLRYGNNNHDFDIDLFLICRYLTINLKYYNINFNILLKPASIMYLFLP